MRHKLAVLNRTKIKAVPLKYICALAALCTNLALAQPMQYLSEPDNFDILIPERLYPTQLGYEQDTQYGRVKVKNVSFHGSLGKFVLDLVDYPQSDQRSATSRIEAKIDQLQQNPDLQISAIEDLSTDLLPGIFIRSFDHDKEQLHGVFIDDVREYHISAESHHAENQDQVLEQTEALIRSFKLATANALYYQVYESRKVDALIAEQIDPGYGAQTLDQLSATAAEKIASCNELPIRTPAELVLMVNSHGSVENAFSSPRSSLGRCLELAYIGLNVIDPPLSEMHLLLRSEEQ